MDKAASRTLIQRYYEAFAQGGALLSPTFHYYPPGLPEGLVGPALHQELCAAHRAAFSDQVYTVTHEVIDGALVACRWVVTATHSGPYAGMPSTGRPITLEGMDLFRVVEGQIAELRRYFDLLALRQQIHGVIGVGPASTSQL